MSDEVNILRSEEIKKKIMSSIGGLNKDSFEKILALKSVASDIENLLIVENSKLSHRAMIANLLNMIKGGGGG